MKSKKEKIEQALKKVDVSVKKAQKLARTAVSVKEKLLAQGFNKTLNDLWLDLFKRLVRPNERFKPQLETTLGRGNIHAEIQGVAEGVEPFKQLAAVLSTGNLNTAALSLFLALHLIEKPKHQLLVLDDPVQSIDDVHVVQLANLLRMIVHEADRQLVVAVHERALFDYLCLELGPTRNEDSLLAIELVRDEKNDETRIRHERRTWKPDQLKFGTAA
ncbi:hypothetical protein IH992_25005 [Candidatus Poribacteria bacterium]|nr:hypothetical protein [Candidatus Poribacteria bacterium]